LYLFAENKEIKTLKLLRNPYTNVSHRLIYWQRAFDNFVQKPFTGSGLDTFNIVNKTRPFAYYAHNFFIQILSDSGIFGFLANTLLIGVIFWRAYNVVMIAMDKRKRLFYLSIFVGVLSSTFLAAIDVDWHLPTVFLIFWIFAGFLRKNVN
jgi:O-antigen ligase